jgi:hypothetical protein
MADYFCTYCGCRHEPLVHRLPKTAMIMRGWLSPPNRGERLSLDADAVSDILNDLDAASGMEAPSGGETEGLDPQDDSPTAAPSGGDAQTEGE